jgi:hypothetical protein
MKHVVLMLMLSAFIAHGADTVMHDAVYFVIHTPQKSVMYRAGGETIFCAPDFYKVRMSNSKQEYICQQLLGDSQAIISFHDKDTAVLASQKDDNPLEKLATWRAMLDRTAKVHVYTAHMYPHRKTLALYDKREHLIVEINDVPYSENNSLEQYKEAMRDFADPRFLNSVQSLWEGERIGKDDKLILSNEQRSMIAEQPINNQSHAEPIAIKTPPTNPSEKNTGTRCVIF